ncbi:protein tyrosine phosphatase [Paenibacillus sp. 32352]|uniref:protein tyrosine phosphatase n=1 Tax=Paenibacillus sp. 32352 TaxID=1969111 RepID=UPI0015C46573|nr:protein tyrosine phosphatase [Paenibacillus sp. 32352]
MQSQIVHRIIDVDNKRALPKKFRMTSPLAEGLSQPPDFTGLTDLRISGSGQFSQQGLRLMQETICQPRITIVDLRQESHGFVNGMAVSWYGPNNGCNMHLTQEEIRAEEGRLLQQLADAQELVFDRLEKKSVDLDSPVTGPKLVQTEEEMVRSEGADYIRFFVTDHHRPSDGEVDRFIRYAVGLPEGTWLHFHCRGGVGRTTSFMLMYDMLHHAGRVSREDLFERHVRIGGKDVSSADPKDEFKYGPALERLDFLHRFYDYCAGNRDGYATTWSQWLAASGSPS